MGPGAGWGDRHTYNTGNRLSAQSCRRRGWGTHRGKHSHWPREVREGFAEAVTFELSSEEKQALCDDMTVGAEGVPRRGDMKYKVLRPERAHRARGNTRNLGSAVGRAEADRGVWRPVCQAGQQSSKPQEGF